ncbi:helix-turn-helix domain-containing protein [Desulfosporosinus sp. FKA]|uniref:helix-turn-helix domain-containing protein n=1 Tax=Desulfosporosinus sp. FKA TaxID=1969834 RepID=UPI000B4A0189|nr:helix-turn-helix domain-containing protein [Desulfosporosinus sp. FKA]
MDDVFHQLRKARETKGIELKDVEEVTKIRTKYLQALEEGNFGILPGGVYAIAYLRSYARFLGLDADSLVHTYRMKVNEPNLETRSEISPKKETGLIFRFLKANSLRALRR